MDWSIEGSHQADSENSVSNWTRKYKQQLSEDAAIGCLHNHEVVLFVVMKVRATINEVYILIEINHGLVDDLEQSIFSNLKGIRDADAQGVLALLM
jgi:hypothetical protein